MLDEPNSLLRGGSQLSTERLMQSSCSLEKKVKIYKFYINGDCDGGAYGEHQLRLDGHKYFPLFDGDCAQETSGYCDFREGQAHNIENKAMWQVIEAYKSITVGTEERDVWNENDSHSNYLSANDWYNPQCAPYEVIISRDFSAETSKKVCWNVGGSVSGSYKGVEGEINAGVESCSEWTEPAESFIWFLKVEPFDCVLGFTDQGKDSCCNGFVSFLFFDFCY